MSEKMPLNFLISEVQIPSNVLVSEMIVSRTYPCLKHLGAGKSKQITNVKSRNQKKCILRPQPALLECQPALLQDQA